MQDEIDLILRLFAGMLAGLAVGFDRTRKQRAAGLRTFGLVGLGTASATAIFAESHLVDAASRVIQGILTGIGFLGAGVILRPSNEDETPRGLTTAAAIWVTAALGCAAGLGQWPITITATILVLLLLVAGHGIERLAGRSEAPADAPAENEAKATEK